MRLDIHPERGRILNTACTECCPGQRLEIVISVKGGIHACGKIDLHKAMMCFGIALPERVQKIFGRKAGKIWT